MGQPARQATSDSFQLRDYDVLGVMEGGMSLVYKIRHRPTGRIMAAKTLKVEFNQDAQAVERFHREAIITRSLQHRNIIRVIHHDCILTRHKMGRHFFIMDFIEGENLQAIIEQRGPLSRDEIVRIISQVCDALHYAHTLAHQPVIHRDLKSNNILIENGTGRAVLTDFGIAQRVGAPNLDSHLIGTAEYMSPEHAQGKPTDERSDLYSLGVIMYEMATGELPFRPSTPGPHAAKEVLAKHCSERPKPPREVNPRVSPSLDAIIMLLLEKDPDRRYQSAAVLQAHLTQQWTTETGFVPYEMIRREARKRLRAPMTIMALMIPLFVALGVAGYLGAVWLWSKHQAARLTDRGAAAYRQGDWDDAAKWLAEAYRRAPSEQRARFARLAEGRARLASGLDKLQDGQLALAIVDLREAVNQLGNRQSREALDRAEAEARREQLMRRGDQAMVEGDLRAAVEAYEQALRARPGRDVQERLNRARAAQWEAKGKRAALQQNWKTALDAYSHALRLNPEPRLQDAVNRIKAQMNVGLMLKVAELAYDTGKLDEALRVLDDLLARQPGGEAQRLRDKVLLKKRLQEAEAQERVGAWAEAAARYREAARLSDSPAVRRKWRHAEAMRRAAEGDRKAAAGDWSAAARLYAQALGFEDSPARQAKLKKALDERDYARFAARARAAEKRGDPDAAIALWGAAKDARPKPEALAALKRLRARKLLSEAETLCRAGEWAAAAEAYEKLVALDPRDAYKKALARAKAEQRYRDAFERGRRAAARRDWKAALDAFRAAAAVKPTAEAEAQAREAGYQARMAEGRTAAAQGEWAAAAEAFRAAKQFKPTEECDLALARAERRLAYEQAFEAGRKALAEERWAAAVTHFQEAVKLRSTDEARAKLQESKFGLLMAFGRTQEEAGDWPRAAEYYRAARQILDRPAAHAALARAQFGERFAAAAKALAQGDAAGARKRFADALAALEALPAAAADPKAWAGDRRDAAARFAEAFLQARVLERRKRFADAIQAYKRAQKLAIDKDALKGQIERCVQALVREP